MPNAARERVASPPAGAALARAAWACLPGRVRRGEISNVHVTTSVISVNSSVTQIIAFSRMRCSVKRCTADPGSLQAPEFGTIPGLQRTADALRCAREMMAGHSRA